MQTIIKPLASMLVMGLFLLIAMATGGSSNIRVGVKKCGGQPEFSSDFKVRIRYKNSDFTPIVGATGTMFIVHQIIEDTVDCKSLIVSQQSIPFTTDALGWADSEDLPFTHLYSSDLWRVEVNIPPKPGQYNGFRKMDVAMYNTLSLIFEVIDPPKL